MTIIEGTVASGHGIASTLPISGMRFDPHPGTLNVVTDTELELDGDPDGWLDPWPGGPIPYRYGTFNGQPVAVLGAAGQIGAGWRLELVAPVHLRTTFGLVDGSAVTLTIGDPVFTYRGETFDYFDHSYNTTALNERAIEVPIGRWFLDKPDRAIEVGNVLGHYGPTPWRVVDRYEPGVENIDLFDIDGQYRRVLAISTVEHVGNWPGEPADPSRAIAAVTHLRSLLARSGRMLVTVPFGQNAPLDEAILESGLGADVSTTMVWSPDGWTELDGAHWGPPRSPHIWPSALWIGEWHRK